MTRKSGKKSGTFAPGPDDRRGHGPEKGAPNAGRPPSEFLRLLGQAMTRQEVLDRFETFLTSKESSATEFFAAFDRASDRVLGKPTQRTVMELNLTPEQRRARVLELLKRGEARKGA